MPSKQKRPTIKALFLDISRTLTGEGSAGERTVNPEAIQALAEYVRKNRISKIAFITALSGPSLSKGKENIGPHLQKYGLDRISELHCESGLYKWVDGKPVFSPEASVFQGIMREYQAALEAAVKHSGLDASNVSLKRGKLVQVRFEFNEDAKRKDKAWNKKLGEVILDAVQRAGIAKNVGVIVTGSGINLQPHDMSKGVITNRIIRNWVREYTERGFRPPRIRGKAVGDFAAEDQQMAANKKIKFKLVSGAGHTAEYFLGLARARSEGRAIRRQRQAQNWGPRQKANQTKKARRQLRR